MSLSVRSYSLDSSLVSIRGFSLSQDLLFSRISSKLMPVNDKKHPGSIVGYNIKWGMTLYLYSQMIKSLKWRIVESCFYPFTTPGLLTFSFWIVIQMFLSCLNFSISSVLLSCVFPTLSITPRINGSPAQYHLKVWNFSSFTIAWSWSRDSI